LIKEVSVSAVATTTLIVKSDSILPSDTMTASATINDPGKYNPKYTIPSRNEEINSPINPYEL
jgi:hypothetical protein